MTAQKVLEVVKEMPYEDWVTIQCGITEMMAAEFAPEEVAEIKVALAESEAEFERGEGMTSEQIQKKLGLL